MKKRLSVFPAALFLSAAMLIGNVYADTEEPVQISEEQSAEIADSVTRKDFESRIYFLNPDGTHYTGWLVFSLDQTYYCDPDNDGAAATGVKKISGINFLFTSEGIYVRTPGIRTSEGARYWIRSNGGVANGWYIQGSKLMYFDPQTYKAVTGTYSIGRRTYVFSSDGVFARYTGVAAVNGKYYWFKDDSSLQSGWYENGDTRMYFFSDTYEAAANGTYIIDGVECTFDANGVYTEAKDPTLVSFDSSWEFADYSVINSGQAVMYYAPSNRNNITVAVNAGHGTSGGSSVTTLSHPDGTPKVSGGTNAEGAVYSTAVSSGMDFNDGTEENVVTLRMAQLLRDALLAEGFDVLMIRDGSDVQLDNIARTVMANNLADCHIALHWDSDGLSYDKGCYYMSVPDALKSMYPVSVTWEKSEAFGDALLAGLASAGAPIWSGNPLDTDLTQTSYSTIPSVDVELGNQVSAHDDATLMVRVNGLVAGLKAYFSV